MYSLKYIKIKLRQNNAGPESVLNLMWVKLSCLFLNSLTEIQTGSNKGHVQVMNVSTGQCCKVNNLQMHH